MLFWAGGTDSGGGDEAARRTHLPLLGGESMAGSLCAERPVNAAAPDPRPRESVVSPSSPPPPTPCLLKLAGCAEMGEGP